MGLRRTVLLGLVAALLAVAAIVATVDVRAGSTNCGSALIPVSVRPELRTGDDLDDEFARQSIQVDCERAITGRRLLTALPLGAAAAAGWTARRDRRRAEAAAPRWGRATSG